MNTTPPRTPPNPPNPPPAPSAADLRIADYIKEFRDALLVVSEQIRKAAHHDSIQVIDVDQARNALYTPQKPERLRESIKVIAPAIVGLAIPYFIAELQNDSPNSTTILITVLVVIIGTLATMWALLA